MKVIIAGDFTTEERGLSSVISGNAISEDICNLFKSADFSILNLEAPIADSSCTKITKSGPHLHTVPIAIEYLKSCGINAVTLANNHLCDFGKGGLRLTLDHLNRNGIKYVGGGMNAKEISKPLHLNTPDGKIAILNYCEHEYSIQNGWGSNPLDLVKCYNQIIDVKKNSSVVIVIVHGGHEGYNLPSPRMQDTYRFFIDCGVNIVINHHQHCYSGYEEYHGGFIYYGLGNFFYDSQAETSKMWTEGFFLSINIERNSIKEIKTYPYVQCRDDAVVTLMTDKAKDDFLSNIIKLNKIIIDRSNLTKHFVKFCNKIKRNYTIVLAPYSNRFIRAMAKRHLLPTFITPQRIRLLENFVNCESHRDILIESLKKKNEQKN